MTESRPIRILYVEDDPAMARLFQRQMTRHGYHVDIATDGGEGLALFKPGVHDLLAVDHQMPVMTGLSLIRELASREELPTTIMITGAGNETIAVEAMKLGASDYVIKDTEGGYLELIPAVVEQALQKRLLIQEKHDALMEAEKARRDWELTFDAVPDLIMILDCKHKIVRANKAMAERFETDAHLMQGQECFRIVHEATEPPPECPHARLLADGNPHTAEIVNDKINSVLLVSCSPLVSESGCLLGSVHVARDITELKNAQQIMVRSERLKAIGDLASGVAHNFNNLLQIVLGSAQLAAMELTEDRVGDALAHIERITECSRLGSETVKRLQDFSRMRALAGARKDRLFDLSDAIRRALDMSEVWWKTIADKHGISIDVQADLRPGCLMRGDESELTEVGLNLIKNAVEAMPRGGTLAVNTFLEGGKVNFTVADTGTGIHREHQSRIFEPFFSTKGFQRGGMGLASSYGIVTQHGGTVSVESAPGEGALFRVVLPRALLNGTDEEPADQGGLYGLRVLVISEVRPVAAMIEQHFTRRGCDVLIAHSGHSALKLLENIHVDAVICDMDTPDMNGRDISLSVAALCDAKDVKKPFFAMMVEFGKSAEVERRALRWGVDQVLERPLDLRALSLSLKRLQQGWGDSQ